MKTVLDIWLFNIFCMTFLIYQQNTIAFYWTYYTIKESFNVNIHCIYSGNRLIWHTKGPEKCVNLNRMSKYSGFILVNRNIFVGCYKMSENKVTSCVNFMKLELNAALNNISVISWRSVLLAEETGVRGEKPLTSQTLSHNVVSSTPRHEWDSSSQH